MIIVKLPGSKNAVVCHKCGALFRGTQLFSNQPQELCPHCGTPGPFQKATDGDIGAYIKRKQAQPLDYLKAILLTIVMLAAAALITLWVVDT
jgi:uncharacterized OB-fold protein